MIKRILPILSLFSSFGTLVCCALPALFVGLGLGATLVSVLGAIPQLIWLSERKFLVFSVAGILLLVTGYMQYQGRHRECPENSTLAAQCQQLKTSGGTIFYLSVMCYVVGGFFAFIAPYFF